MSLERLQLDSAGVRVTKVVRTPEGFLDIWGTLASTADRLVYGANDPGGARTEQVHLAALQSGLKTLIGAPVTLEHPKDDDGNGVPVSSANWSRYAVGSVLDAKIVDHPKYEDEYNQDVHIRVADLEAASRIDTREITDLSPGYQAKKKKLAEGLLLQLKRNHNHVAITVEGRGENATMHLDSKYGAHTPPEGTMKNGPDPKTTEQATETEPEATEPEQTTETEPVVEPQVDSGTCAVCGGADSARLYEDSQIENDKLQAQLDSMKLEMDSMREDIMARDAKAAEDEGLNTDSAPQTDSEPKRSEHEIMVERQEVVELAEVYKVEGMADMQTDSLRKEVVRAATGENFRDGKSKHYYDGMFEGLLAKYHVSKANSVQSAVTTVVNSRLQEDSVTKPVDPILGGIKIVSTKEQRDAFSGKGK